MIKKYNITVNGSTYKVEVEELGNEVIEASREKVSHKSSEAVQEKASVITKPHALPVSGDFTSVNAPMPGTIKDICVSVGDVVKKGQVLIILEAMKMENELVASCDGRISEVKVSKGALVNVGDILITIG